MTTTSRREVNDKNQIWVERDGESVRIGFTQTFLNELDQCWHILPSSFDKFKVKSPLLTVETNDSLISILSPINAAFVEYSDKAQNFPDKLVEDDVVISLTTSKNTSVSVPKKRVGAADFGVQPAWERNGFVEQIRQNHVVHDDALRQQIIANRARAAVQADAANQLRGNGRPVQRVQVVIDDVAVPAAINPQGRF